MKTYFLSTLDRIKVYSKLLDAKAILYDKHWEVFNDSGVKEVFIFKPNSELLISRNGIVEKGKWELLSSGCVLLDVNNNSFLFNAAFTDNSFLALQLDGTNECMVMIETQLKDNLLLDSIEKVNTYLEKTYSSPENVVVNPDNNRIIVDNSGSKTLAVIAFVLLVIFSIICALLNAN